MITTIGHIFISYARSDLTFLRKIKNQSSLLSALFWYDVEGIERKEPDWRGRIESATSRAGCVFVLCSPASKTSQSVIAELELAVAFKKPIYPIWIEGETWAESAPFSLLAYNYTDIRFGGASVVSEIETLISSEFLKLPAILESTANLPQRVVDALFCRIRFRSAPDKMDDGHSVLINPHSFPTFLEMVSIFYDRYLFSNIQPFSYGSEWFFRSGDLCLLPAEWAIRRGTPIHQFGMWWLAQTPEKCGIRPGANIELTLYSESKDLAIAGIITDLTDVGFLWLYAHKLRRAIPTKIIQRRTLSKFSKNGFVQCCLILDETAPEVISGRNIFGLPARRRAQSMKEGAIYFFSSFNVTS